MAVRIGSARIDERGKARGGKAGDQTGRELSVQNWYNRITNPWVLIRAKDAAHREKIATCMERACANSKIGYDQNGRDTLYNAAAVYQFDVSKVVKAVETDCSALVRVCVSYATGRYIENFRTTNEASVLMKTGLFSKFTTSKYIHSSAYLMRGDILVTKRQGHTVVVLSNGAKAELPAVVVPPIVPPSDPATTLYKVRNIFPDVSQNQGAVANFDTFCAGTDCAIFRVVRGNGLIDTQAIRNMKNCVARAYPFGVYIFFNSRTEAAARAEVRKLYATASPYKPRFYVLDIEKWLPEKAVLAAVDELRKLGVTGAGGAPFLMSYMGEWRWRTRYRKMLEKLVDAFWIANYGKNNGTVSKIPKVPYDLHQYTSVGRVPGIKDKTCDLNRLGQKPLSFFTGRQYDTVIK